MVISANPAPTDKPSRSSFDLAEIARPAIRVFNDKDGIPQNSILSLAVDKRGYIWAGTQDGVCFYNGRKWTVVKLPIENGSTFVHDIVIDKSGTIWMALDSNGVARYKNEQWQIFNTGSGLPSNKVRALLETVDNNGSSIIWAATTGGLARYQQEQWQSFELGLTLTDKNILSLAKFQNNHSSETLWIGTTEGLIRFQPTALTAAQQWTRFDSNSGLPSNNIFSLMAVTEGNGSQSLWVGTNEGLACWQNNQWQRFDKSNGLPDNYIQTLGKMTDSDGSTIIWAGTRGGLAGWQHNRWRVIDTGRGLPDNLVMSLLETTTDYGSRTLWIGTNGSGLARIQSGQWSTIDTRAGLQNNVVMNLLDTAAVDGSRIYWFATYGGGLARRHKDQWRIYNTKNGLPNDVIFSIVEAQDNSGAIWIGTFGGGLVRLQDDKFTRYNIANGLNSNNIISLLTTKAAGTNSEVLWVGSWDKGLARLQDGQWSYFDINSGLPNNHIMSLLETTDQQANSTLWVGTSGGGLARWHNGQWSTFNTSNGLPDNNILSLMKTFSADGRQWLWAGTRGGVARLDLTTPTSKWQTLNDKTSPALPNTTINQLRADQKGRIYLFTNRGIARLNQKDANSTTLGDYQLYIFTTDDGLPSNECNQGSAMIDSQGRIWAGTVAGAAIFDPLRDVEGFQPKPFYIERAQVVGSNRRLLGNDALNYKENRFIFEYSLLSYFRESDTRYRTQLIGLDREPSEWSNESKKEYPVLQNGDYVFKVWAMDYLGNIAGPVEIAFSIPPAPWFTWWAYLSYFGLGGLGIYGGMRYYLRNLQRLNEILEAKVRDRTAEVAKKNQQLDEQIKELDLKNEQLSKSQQEMAEKNAELAKKNEELASKNEELIQSHLRADRIFSALAEVLPGTVLDEKYRLESKIGAGGFGAVYRATHLNMKRSVAVKIFRPASGNASADNLDRFLMEAVSTCRVNHANAVSVLDSGVSAEGIAYLVMELLEGYPLSVELGQHNTLSLSRCAEIIIPVCDVLAEAHRAGIIHRDIKPDNIFLHQTKDGEIIKVVDFGIAKLMNNDAGGDSSENLTHTGGFIGTPTYMAPERLDNRPYDGRSDVYSLGILCYQMLTGRVPFRAEGEGLWTLVFQHISKPPAPLRELNPTIPPAIEELVLRTLSKLPGDRPDARELGQQFAQLIGIKLETNRNTGPLKLTVKADSMVKDGNGEVENIHNIDTADNSHTTQQAVTVEEITLIRPKE